MLNEEQEEVHLAEAEGHFAKAKELIHLQRRRIARMQAQGVSTEEAEEMLTTMLVSLALMERHRDLILDRLGKMKRSSTVASPGWLAAPPLPRIQQAGLENLRAEICSGVGRNAVYGVSAAHGLRRI